MQLIHKLFRKNNMCVCRRREEKRKGRSEERKREREIVRVHDNQMG